MHKVQDADKGNIKYMNCKNGKLIIVSGPSGVGKGTVCGILLKSNNNIVKSVSVTTRNPRKGEINGVNYFFVTKDEYQKIKQEGGFLETFEIYGNFYGTPIKFVEENLKKGINVLLEIDVQGALEVKRKMPSALLIFLLPPSMEVLCERLKGRNTEDSESFKRRMESAQAEIQNKSRYDYCVVNDNAQKAAEEILQIISKYQNT
jgi:guanylate kinase